MKTPDYYLTNTGMQEFNFSLQLEKQVSSNWKLKFFGNSFNTDLGVLRGSQIGNLTDLESAIGREIPFYTEEKFSYKIQAPKQKVNHHLIQIQSENTFENNQQLETQIAVQYDGRKEYDVRRGNRSDIPALSLEQYSLFAESKYQKRWEQGIKLNTGLQFQGINNYNEPNTGILPLIPNYNSYQIGSFGQVQYSHEKSLWESGLRIDFTQQDVRAISQSSPREVVKNKNKYTNFNAMLGYQYQFNKNYKLSTNLGYATRNPAINELYSQGLHQGVSGIEEGDTR